MTLSEYLCQQGISHQAFGALIGADRKTIWRYVRGLSIPRAERMSQISEATGGAVTPADFYAQDAEGEAA